jgi:hypothetical protein
MASAGAPLRSLLQREALTSRHPRVATYSLVIRRLMICSLTIVMSRAMTSPLLTLFLSSRLGLNQQDVGLLMGIAVFIATLLGLYGGSWRCSQALSDFRC